MTAPNVEILEDAGMKYAAVTGAVAGGGLTVMPTRPIRSGSQFCMSISRMAWERWGLFWERSRPQSSRSFASCRSDDPNAAPRTTVDIVS